MSPWSLSLSFSPSPPPRFPLLCHLLLLLLLLFFFPPSRSLSSCHQLNSVYSHLWLVCALIWHCPAFASFLFLHVLRLTLFLLFTPVCLTFQLPKREDLIGPVSHSEARVRLSHTCGLAALEAGVQPAVATWQSHTAQHTVCEQPPRNNCGCGRQVTEHVRLFPSVTYKM